MDLLRHLREGRTYPGRRLRSPDLEPSRADGCPRHHRCGIGQPNAPSLVVYPGRHYGGEPFGRYVAARTRVPNFRLDFGLITLTKPVDSSLLWWGHPSTNTDWWSGAVLPLPQLRQTALPITTAGFPGVKDAYRRRMYEARGVTVPATFGATFRHTADTTQGQSGSPVWTERGDRRVLIGIVSAYDRRPNQIAVFAHDATVRDWCSAGWRRTRPDRVRSSGGSRSRSLSMGLPPRGL